MNDTISERYKPYLNRIPGNMITRPIDFLNYSIQSINLPGASFSPSEQVGKLGRKRIYRDSIPTQELIEKQMTVTFQLLDGYINYWMMLDIYNDLYAYENRNVHIPSGTNLRILDAEGNVLVTLQMNNVLFTEIGSLEMSFSDNTPDFSTFETTFVYNELITKIELK
jgi:hypothetical protein